MLQRRKAAEVCQFADVSKCSMKLTRSPRQAGEHDPPVSAEALSELPGLFVQAVGEADGEGSKAIVDLSEVSPEIEPANYIQARDVLSTRRGMQEAQDEVERVVQGRHRKHQVPLCRARPG
jgi:hypothetical protein